MGRKSFLLRVSQELYDDLQSWAAQELRSVNAQIEYLLRRAVRERSGRAPESERGTAADAPGDSDAAD